MSLRLISPKLKEAIQRLERNVRASRSSQLTQEEGNSTSLEAVIDRYPINPCYQPPSPADSPRDKRILYPFSLEKDKELIESEVLKIETSTRPSSLGEVDIWVPHNDNTSSIIGEHTEENIPYTSTVETPNEIQTIPLTIQSEYITPLVTRDTSIDSHLQIIPIIERAPSPEILPAEINSQWNYLTQNLIQVFENVYEGIENIYEEGLAPFNNRAVHLNISTGQYLLVIVDTQTDDDTFTFPDDVLNEIEWVYNHATEQVGVFGPYQKIQI